MPDPCAFCSNPANSQEHVWPDWLARKVGDRELLPHTFAVQRGFAEPEIARTYKGRPFALTVGVVCRDCNNGWMSHLESGVARIMGCMLEGRGRELHRGEQTKLAAWAVKSAVIFDHLAEVSERVVPRQHAEVLRATGEPPPGTQVWIASYDDTNNVAVSRGGGFETVLRGQQELGTRNVYTRTFTIGGIVFQVYGTTTPELAELRIKWPVPNIHEIWPVKSVVTWRPLPDLDDEAVEYFANHIQAGLSAQADEVLP